MALNRHTQPEPCAAADDALALHAPPSPSQGPQLDTGTRLEAQPSALATSLLPTPRVGKHTAQVLTHRQLANPTRPHANEPPGRVHAIQSTESLRCSGKTRRVLH